MKHHRVFLAITMLLLATLACQSVMGGGDTVVDEDTAPATESSLTQPAEILTEVPAEGIATDESESIVSSQFPMTADAYNIVEMEDGSLIYYTKLSAEETVQFYRDEYTSQGYTEREELTIVNDAIFNLAFDGDPSGKSVVIQSVDLGDGSRTIAIRLEEI